MIKRAYTYPDRTVVFRGPLPPGPPEPPIVGQTFRYMSDLLGLLKEAAKYGDLVTLSTKPILIYLVNHPDLIRELFVTNHQSVGRGFLTGAYRYLMGNGLVTSDGALHLRQRRLMQPQFHHGRIAAYAETMTEYALRHEAGWHDGDRVDMAREMSELTLHIVVKTLFGVDPPDEAPAYRGRLRCQQRLHHGPQQPTYPNPERAASTSSPLHAPVQAWVGVSG